MASTKIQANIPGIEPYDIRIGDNVLDRLGADMRGIDAFAKARHIVVVTDENVGPLYLSRVMGSLKDAGYKASKIMLPAGEESKNPQLVAEIWQACAALGLERDDALVALGGGVVGDITGFAAATYMRGIAYAQVPTTLLAMVDSSVGGKTGIDLEAGKNLVGCFHHPSYVCASVETLGSLPDREWLCGMGEVAKMAMVGSDELFFWLEDNAPDLAARDIGVAMQAIIRCVVAKVNCVAQDPRDTLGIRAALNYGHTLGHAIEKVAGYGEFSHGMCVAQGMRFAGQISRRLAAMPPELEEAQAMLLDSLGLHAIDLTTMNVDELLEAMHADKKNAEGTVRMVLLSDIGATRLELVTDFALRTILELGDKA